MKQQPTVRTLSFEAFWVVGQCRKIEYMQCGGGIQCVS